MKKISLLLGMLFLFLKTYSQQHILIQFSSPENIPLINYSNLTKGYKLTSSDNELDKLFSAYTITKFQKEYPSAHLVKHRFAPINQYFSQSAAAVNDRSFCSVERVSLQLRRFNLGTTQRDSGSADIKEVTWFALHVPTKLRKDVLIEARP